MTYTLKNKITMKNITTRNYLGIEYLYDSDNEKIYLIEGNQELEFNSISTVILYIEQEILNLK